MHANKLGRYFEEFEKGAVIEHELSKTIFESDNNLFCLLTMNPNPLHTNVEYAEKNNDGKILVVGTLVFSLVVGISVTDISGKAIANLCYEDIVHKNPVYLNDTIHAKSTILEIRESKTKRDRGIIYVETKAYNQYNVEVISFRRKVLVKKRESNE
ncbi:MAG: MaoC family dehydratase [Melioribacteraceae bacterium]|nr:MaoC family dehydratase [Melioribacteraceae bacterium]